MLEYNKRSFGTTKRKFFVDLFRGELDRRDIEIPVPVSISHSLIGFDLESAVKKKSEFEGLTKESIKALLSLLAKSEQFIDTNDLQDVVMDILPEDKKQDDEQVSALVQTIKFEMRRIVMRSSVAPSFYTAVIDDAYSDDAIESIKALHDLSNLHQVVLVMQKIYAGIADRAESGTIGNLISDQLTHLPAYSGALELDRTFANPPGLTLPVRASYVMEQIENVVYGRPHFGKEERLPGFFEELTQINDIPDVNFAEMMAAYLYIVYLIQGTVASTEEIVQPLSSIVSRIVSGVGTVMPFVAPEAGPIDMEKVKKLVSVLWTDRIIILSMEQKPGMIENRFRTILETNKYRTDTSWERIVHRTFRVGGRVFDAMLDVAAKLRGWLEDKTIYFKDISPTLRNRLLEIMNGTLATYGEWRASAHMARYLKQPAFVIHHEFRGESHYIPWISPAVDVDPILHDDEYRNDPSTNGGRVMITPEGGYISVLTTGLTKGSLANVEDILPISIFLFSKFSRKFAPYYVMKRNLPSLLSTNPIFKAYTRFQSILDVKKTGFFTFLRRRAELRDFLDMRDLARDPEINLPPIVIEDAIKEKPIFSFAGTNLLMDFGGSLDQAFVYFSSDLIPFYDEIETEERAPDGVNNMMVECLHPFIYEASDLPQNNSTLQNFGMNPTDPTDTRKKTSGSNEIVTDPTAGDSKKLATDPSDPGVSDPNDNSSKKPNSGAPEEKTDEVLLQTEDSELNKEELERKKKLLAELKEKEAELKKKDNSSKRGNALRW